METEEITKLVDGIYKVRTVLFLFLTIILLIFFLVNNALKIAVMLYDKKKKRRLQNAKPEKQY